MGLLGDIYSAIDTKKRQVKGLLDDFGGTVDMGVRRFREDQQNLQNLFANAYPMAGDKTVLNSPQQIAQFQREAADKAGEMGLAGATVWHGSPHKFDKFDSSKIGTGEGAQSYGHGLYLAESPKVADTYAKYGALGTYAKSPDDFFHNGERYVNFNGKIEKQLKSGDWVDAAKPELDKAFEQAAKDFAFENKGVGNLYKVDLPDEHIAKMLDWDKPLSEQAPEVQSALKMLDPETWHPSSGDYDANELGQSIYQRLMNQSRDGAITAGRNAQTTLGASQASASDDLRAFGVPGIRYLDGGSRGAGAGTSNYVVFPGNEGLLKIMERNGQPVGGLLK